MYLGSKNSNAEYMRDGTTLESVTEEKDLVVLIDDELKFHNMYQQQYQRPTKLWVS